MTLGLERLMYFVRFSCKVVMGESAQGQQEVFKLYPNGNGGEMENSRETL